MNAVVTADRAEARGMVVLLATTALVATGLVVLVRPLPAAAAVEDDGADCPVAIPSNPPGSSLLPGPFTRLNGPRIATVGDWRCRRAGIRNWPNDSSAATSRAGPRASPELSPATALP